MPSSWVEPAAPVLAGIVKCSALDNLTAPVYPSPTHFFPLKPGADPLKLYEDCKRGLSRCIYEHPHLSGVLIKDDRGRNSINIRSAPWAGTNFWYKDHRNDADVPSYKELKHLGWPFADGDKDGLGKLRPVDFPSLEDGDPIIAPQFNVIKGGIVLTMSIAHAIGDLVQFMEFVRSWAKNTSAVATSRMEDHPLPSLPQQVPAHLLDRSLLIPDVEIEEDLDKLTARAASLPHLSMLDPRRPEELAETANSLFTKACLSDKDLSTSSEDELRTLSCSVWTFSQSSLEELKRVTQMALPKASRVSSIDSLTAFTWNRFFVAKHAPEHGPSPDMTRIVFAGSIRRRLTPPLPDGYLPACVDLFPVPMKTSNFTSPAPKTLAMTAKMVRESNNNWDEKVFRNMLEIAHSHPMNPGLVPKGPIEALVTDHTRASSAVLESWGPGLGRCEAFREPYLGRDPPYGEITLLPRWHDGSVDVMFSGEAVVMERLHRDRFMNQMASCQFIMGKAIHKTGKARRISKM
ncbi:hypothetical protein F53441_4772 [Fusarium austroafricanum]|uniref:Trichothecene 3-O-acetyltransferase n=1 Tax=Fusarium austroafricanum TaxID=2364996 RepID=A0A8H4KMG0_9HYPO|nr:hypothetical protein F53441_4772 [Fusarium austroafricanum]